MRYLLAVLLFLLLSVPARTDGIDDVDSIAITFSSINAPGGIGDLSWTVVVPSFGQSLDTKTWLDATNPTKGAGCKISEIGLEAEGLGTYGFSTFFSPLCDGKYDAMFASVNFAPLLGDKEYGTVHWSGTNPDGSTNHESLKISPTDHEVTASDPVATSEASTLTLLLACVVCFLGFRVLRFALRVLRLSRLR